MGTPKTEVSWELKKKKRENEINREMAFNKERGKVKKKRGENRKWIKMKGNFNLYIIIYDAIWCQCLFVWSPQFIFRFSKSQVTLFSKIRSVSGLSLETGE
jgi:hypothetical protein